MSKEHLLALMVFSPLLVVFGIMPWLYLLIHTPEIYRENKWATQCYELPQSWPEASSTIVACPHSLLTSSDK